MKKINREKLQNKYKFLKPTNIREGLMLFGFEVGDGWLEILSELFKSINIELNKSIDSRKHFKVTQVKEKFGELRVYVSGSNDKIDKFIEVAEQKSYKTCESCGKSPATQNKNGWIVTLCKTCRKNR